MCHIRCKLICVLLACAVSARPATRSAQAVQASEPELPTAKLAADNFGADAPWFLRNIPFFEIDDPEIQQIYCYRWKLFRAHIREIGPQGTTVLEFLDNVPWARQPYTDLNDSASFHILEGRWLRNPEIVNSLIDHLYTGGGNDRHFSESIAAATEASTRVSGDPAPALRHLDTMQHIFNLWDDHLDRARGLYWIEPLLDATEYTTASIDASGAGFTDQPSADQNHNGFTGGYSFRPSINSYQYANALAIARLATLAGKPEVASDFNHRAEQIRSAVLAQLWNPALGHFTDRYQRSTKYVEAGNFIRGRELVGFIPGFYELPPKDAPAYAAAWKHLLSPAELAGPFGLRTFEPTYPHYLTQYRYDQSTGRPECQWNGPSWPFQTSQALTALANLLDDYPPAGVTSADFLRLLRQYTHQHLLSPGHPDLQEDYNPDSGTPIVGLARSHHYNHSTYVDLILSGLIGIRPRADETLELDPLLPTQATPSGPAIRYFALQNLSYHGYDVGIFYDVDGSRYRIGRGLSVFVDGKRLSGPGPLMPIRIALPPRRSGPIYGRTTGPDLAVNPGLIDGPSATASSTASPTGTAQAIDGRLWFFPENTNGWSPAPTETSSESWYAVDLGHSHSISAVELYFFSDGETYEAPSAFRLQAELPGGGWKDVPKQVSSPIRPLANGVNRITFPARSTQRLRVVLTNSPRPHTLRLIEFKAFAP